MSRSVLHLLCTVVLAAPLSASPLAQLRAQGAVAPAVESAATAADVTLLDAGAAPRRVLRYALTKGSSESVSMRQQMGLAMEMNGMAMPAQSMPATLMATKVDVGDVAADGTADVTVTIERVDLDTVGADPMLVAQMRPAFASFSGVTMRYRMTPSGQLSNLALSENAPPQLQAAQALGSTEQLSVALPADAVGVGARWTASRAVEQNGMTIRQDMEYTVRSLAADSAVLELVVVQSAKDQRITLPGMPPNAEATLRSLDGRGTSSVVIRFDRVQPRLDMTLKATMRMDVNVADESVSMNQTMNMDLKTVGSSPP
jgi:hypothetical protein